MNVWLYRSLIILIATLCGIAAYLGINWLLEGYLSATVRISDVVAVYVGVVVFNAVCDGLFQK